jgi:crotonobetaine/carnitine-CoA ligase
VRERPGEFDVPALVAALRERLPAYVVPRYVDVIDTFPRTSSGKLCRRTLREMPLLGDTFDRKHDLVHSRSANPVTPPAD